MAFPALSSRPFDFMFKSHTAGVQSDYFRALVRAVPLGVCGADGQGRVVFLNPAAEKYTGRHEEDCKGRLFHHLTQCLV